MSYLVVQLWLFLLIAFVIGVVAGWYTSAPSKPERN
jgi:hypothetical protein